MRRFGSWWRSTAIVGAWRRTVGRATVRVVDRSAASLNRVRARWASSLPPKRKVLSRWRRHRWRPRRRPYAIFFVPVMSLVLIGAVGLSVWSILEFAQHSRG